LLLRYL